MNACTLRGFCLHGGEHSMCNDCDDKFKNFEANKYLLYLQENNVYQGAVDAYGKQSQEWMIVEELSELTKEICKHQRGENNTQHIIEEIADVMIMIEQAKLIYQIDDTDIKNAIEKKTERLRKRLLEVKKT